MVRQRPGVPVGQGYKSTEMGGAEGREKESIHQRAESKQSAPQGEQRRGCSMGPEGPARQGDQATVSRARGGPCREPMGMTLFLVNMHSQASDINEDLVSESGSWV